MKWVAISGSRKTNTEVEKDVRREVKEIITRGDGIVSGGALGVDYIATDEALKLNLDALQIKIFLPTTFETYVLHYRKRADEGVITKEQAEMLIAELSKLKKVNQDSLIENPDDSLVDKETYYQRNTRIVNLADELIAFHINQSEGTQDTITKAERKGIPIKKFVYTIE